MLNVNPSATSSSNTAGRAPGQLNPHIQSRSSALDVRLVPTAEKDGEANNSGNAFLSPNPQVTRLINGRPITTIRTVTGNSGPIALSSTGSSTTMAAGSFNSAMPIRSLISAPLSSTLTSSSPMSSDIRNGQLETLIEKLAIEKKMKEGAENLLLVLDSKKPKDAKRARQEAEKALNEANDRIDQLTTQVDFINTRNNKQLQTDSRSRLASKFRGEPLLPVPQGVGLPLASSISEEQLSSESPTWSLSDLLQSLEEKGHRPELYVEKANGLVHLFKRHPTLKYDLVWSAFGKRVQFMLTHESREVVSAGYRIARYAITDLSSLKTIKTLKTDIIVINSLAKDHTSSDARSNVEREQALKFVRAFIEIPGGAKEISKGVIRALVSCAEQSDDRLRSMCIETLAELLILDPSRTVSAGGVRVLGQVLADGPAEISDSVVIAFLYLLDTPETRQFVRPGHDLEVVFSPFTEPNAKAHTYEEKLRSCAKVISSIFKSWPGVLALSMHNLRSIKSLVQSLRIPHVGVRDIILELLFDIFRIKPPSWSSTFLAGRRLTTYGRVANLKSVQPLSIVEENKDKINLVDHFIALLLAIFTESGLLNCLLSILEEEDGNPTITRKATLMVGELLKLSDRLLPKEMNTKLQMLPSLFRCATQFEGTSRKTATSAVYQIDSLNRTLHRTVAHDAINPISASTDDEKRGQRQVEQVKLKMNLQIDESHFRSLILDSQILNTKNHTKWKLDALLELVQGPLLNPKRLDEALKGTKFLKRLMSFFRPFKHRFSDIKNTKPNQRLVRLGCTLFYTLLQNAEGVKYLADHKVLRQIAECLAQLDPMSGITSADPLFSKIRLQDTLCSGYFIFLGVLSTDPNGIAMMERWKMFNMFYHISELRSRDDLMFHFISSMDFSSEGHPRIILSKALTTGQKAVRLFATNHLRGLVDGCRKPLQNPLLPPLLLNNKTSETSEWAIRSLVTQLYDPDVEVCETAVKILEEACNAKASLEYVVQCRPALDHMGEIGAPLLLKFLSTSVGYHYLNELDYINREMDDWFHGRNDAYVDHVEASLARALADDDRPRKLPDGTLFPDNDMIGSVPPHFYRELAKTTEGCNLLEDKGHFQEFAMFISENADECEDAEIVTKVKGCLWSIGNIGSLPSGAPFLENSDIVEKIIHVAETSNVLSLKGTAFFVLGMLSRTSHGLELLDAFGWDANISDMGELLGFCIPKRLDRLLSLEPWSYTASEIKHDGLTTSATIRGMDDSLVKKLLTAIANLSNHILANDASKELAKLKQSNIELFQSPAIYIHALQFLESYRYRLPVRRFILELFDRRCVENIVKSARDIETMDDSS